MKHTLPCTQVFKWKIIEFSIFKVDCLMENSLRRKSENKLLLIYIWKVIFQISLFDFFPLIIQINWKSFFFQKICSLDEFFPQFYLIMIDTNSISFCINWIRLYDSRSFILFRSRQYQCSIIRMGNVSQLAVGFGKHLEDS